MINQPHLNDQEWRIVLHLLEQERGDLKSEVRRTREPHMHDDLRNRERTVEDLIGRLRTTLDDAAPPGTA
jgi:hypothetical protein